MDSESEQPEFPDLNSGSSDIHASEPGVHADDAGSIWSRPCGVRAVLVVALPLVVSTMSYTVMQFCDRLFLTWYSNLDLAAVVPAGALSWTLMSLPLGIAMYANTFVAQYDGARLRHLIGVVVWQAVWLGLLSVPVFILIGLFSDSFYQAIGHSTELVWREAAYFRALSFSSGIVVINAGISAFYIGRGKTNVVMIVNLIAAAVNIGLDYALIFGVSIGEFQLLSEGGIAGAGWATTIAIWSKTAVLLLLFLMPVNRKEFATLAGCRFDWSRMRGLLKFGLPNGFQFFVEGAAITVFILIIARIDDLASAATALAFSVNMIVFVPVLGVGIGVTTLVGQQIGQNRPHLAARATWTAMFISLVYTGIFAIAYIAVPDWFLAAHNMGTNEIQDVEELAITLLGFVAVYCLFDSIQLIFVSAIKGAGDTYFVVFTTIWTSIVFLLVGNYGAPRFTDSEEQILFWWACLTGWIFLLSVVYGIRFLRGKWKTMTVIEPELVRQKKNQNAEP